MDSQFLMEHNQKIQNIILQERFHQNDIDMKQFQFYQENFQNNETEKNFKNKSQTQQNNKIEWTLEEQKRLSQLHDKLGNRWAIISNLIPGKTDNAIKNHFFSKLRKGLRKINKVIEKSFKKQIKQLKMIVIYKIIEGAEQRYKQTPLCNIEVSELCTKLKNRVLDYSDDNNQLNDYDKNPSLAHDLIKDLVSFTKQYKRKNKKSRKNSNQSQSYESIASIAQSHIYSESGSPEKINSLFKSFSTALNLEQKQIKQQSILKVQQPMTTRRRAKSKQQIYLTKQTIKNQQQNLQQQINIQSKFQYFSQNKIRIEDFQIFQQFVPPYFQILKKCSHTQMSVQNYEQPQKYHYFQQSSLQMKNLNPKHQQDQFKNYFFYN